MCKLVDEDYAQELRAEGRKEGHAEGREEGQIIGAVKMGLELGLTRDDIVSRLMKNFSLNEDDVMRCYYLYSRPSTV